MRTRRSHCQPPSNEKVKNPVKFKMAEKSLFAVLLRSPWWISFLVVGLMVLAARVLLPAEYFVVGALSGFPIFVVGCVAAWRQLQAPHPARVAVMMDAIACMPWRSFADALVTAWTRAGYTVARVEGAKPGPADLVLTQGGKTTLVSARRWKAATHGVEPLRELHAAMQAQEAAAAIYVASHGQLSDNARIFARDHGITVLQGDAVAVLLLRP
jgi:restriction system protein